MSLVRAPHRGPACRASTRTGRAKGSGTCSAVSMVFSTVPLGDADALDEATLIETVVSAVATIPTGEGTANVSSSQRWSRRGGRQVSTYEVLGKSAKRPSTVVARLRARGVTAKPLDWGDNGINEVVAIVAPEGSTLQEHVDRVLERPSSRAPLRVPDRDVGDGGSHAGRRTSNRDHSA